LPRFLQHAILQGAIFEKRNLRCRPFPLSTKAGMATQLSGDVRFLEDIHVRRGAAWNRPANRELHE
jgi:hypothetical protein